jgi:hypothetical protein
VHTSAHRLRGNVWLVPLWSWYHRSFDTEPDITGWAGVCACRYARSSHHAHRLPIYIFPAVSWKLRFSRNIASVDSADRRGDDGFSAGEVPAGTMRVGIIGVFMLRSD